MFDRRTKTEQVCAYSMQRGIIKGESGITTTPARTDTANTFHRDNEQGDHSHGADEYLRAPPTRVGKEAASMTDKDETLFQGVPALSKALGMALEKSSEKRIQIDTAKYQAYLDDPDLSDEQKEQIVEALWQIILCFVDLGFGISPLQQACGKLAESDDDSGNSDSALLSSNPTTLSETFNLYAAE